MIKDYDSTQNPSDNVKLWQPELDLSGGEIAYTVKFYKDYNPIMDSGIEVTLQNVVINSYDIDYDQYQIFGGFKTYTVTSAGSNIYSSVLPDGTMKFQGPSDSNNNSPKDRVQVLYDSISEFKIAFGNAEINRDKNYFGIDFSLGDSWGEPTTDDTTQAAYVDYNQSTVTEVSANDGLIAETILVTLNNDTFTRSSGTFGTTGDTPEVIISNVPLGLTAVLTATSTTTAILSFTGNASSHEINNSIDNLTIEFQDAAFNDKGANVITGSKKSDINIVYIEALSSPSLGLIKTAVTGRIAEGETISYYFSVRNTGDVNLTNINITDVNATVTGGPINLAVGEEDNTTFSAIHVITSSDIATGYVTNQATVTGKDPNNNDITDDSDDNSTTENDPTVTTLTILTPGITLEKTGIFRDENNDGYADIGETIYYEFNITNTGTVVLTDVNITDLDAVVSGGPISSMASGVSDTTTFTAVYTIGWQDIIAGEVLNQAVVSAKDPENSDINDTSNEVNTALPIKSAVLTNDIGVGITDENITIDIVNNDAPGTFTLDESTVTLSAPTGATDVLTADGDIIGFTVPGEGTWSVNESTGFVTFSPEEGYMGDPTPIDYTIEDSQGNASTSQISINYPPVAHDDNVTGEQVEIINLDVLLNDQNTSDPFDRTTVRLIDPDGDRVETLYMLNEGTWTVESNGTVTFDPDAGFAGNARIKYIVEETNGDVSNEATINISYLSGHLLATDNGVIRITQYAPTVIDVLANGDSWGNNGPGTTEIIFTQPIYGTVALDDGGTENDPTDDVLIYTPYPDYNDINDSFTYTITDASGLTSTANVRLYVECGSTQTSDGGDALGLVSMLMMMFLTATIGLYVIRREEERGEA